MNHPGVIGSSASLRAGRRGGLDAFPPGVRTVATASAQASALVFKREVHHSTTPRAQTTDGGWWKKGPESPSVDLEGSGPTARRRKDAAESIVEPMRQVAASGARKGATDAMEIRFEEVEATHGRPTPLHGQLGEQVVTCRLVRARTRADGRLTDEEQAEEDAANARLESLACRMAEMGEGFAAALGGADGLTSRNFLRIVHRAERAKVIQFRTKRATPVYPDAA